MSSDSKTELKDKGNTQIADLNHLNVAIIYIQKFGQKLFSTFAVEKTFIALLALYVKQESVEEI